MNILRRSIVWSGIAASVLLCAGCSGGDTAGGTGVGNPGAVAAVRMLAISDTAVPVPVARAASLPLMLVDAAADTFLLDTAIVRVNTITFVRTDGDTVINGPFVFDLMSGKAPDNLLGLRLPAGTYTEMDLSIDEPAMDINDIRLAGVARLSGGARRFDFGIDYFDSATTIRQHFADNIPITVAETDSICFLVTLAAGSWFKAVAIDGLFTGGDLDTNEAGSIIMGGPAYRDVARNIRRMILNPDDSGLDDLDLETHWHNTEE